MWYYHPSSDNTSSISLSSLLWLPTKWTQYLETSAVGADTAAICGVEALLATTNRIYQRSPCLQIRQFIPSLGQFQAYLSIQEAFGLIFERVRSVLSSERSKINHLLVPGNTDSLFSSHLGRRFDDSIDRPFSPP